MLNLCFLYFDGWICIFCEQRYQCVQEYGRNMPRLMKCRHNKGRRRMQRDGYGSKKHCPCGRKKNRIDAQEKLSQTEFLMKHASKGKLRRKECAIGIYVFYSALSVIYYRIEVFFFFRFFTKIYQDQKILSSNYWQCKLFP